MRKVIGIGESILDIIFEDDQPRRAVVGGSVLNGMVSLSRMGVPVTFVSEIGDDHVSDIICNFMQKNGMTTEYINHFNGRKSPVSLAFLGHDKSASYIFHTDYPENRLNGPFPDINENDILVFGSFYAINPLFRHRFKAFIQKAKENRALIYYDPNIRPSHKMDAAFMHQALIENYECATVVRGSNEDFLHLYGNTNMSDVYRKIIKHRCKNFVTTHGANGVNLFTETIEAHFDSHKITPISTIGAGDNFNAGIVYGLIKYGIEHHQVDSLTEAEWGKIIACGMDFSAEVCMSYNNYVSPEFAVQYQSTIK